MESETEASGMMDVRQAANYLNCHTSTIYRMLKEQKLPAFRLGSDWRFSRELLDKWVAEQSMGGGGIPAPLFSEPAHRPGKALVRTKRRK